MSAEETTPSPSSTLTSSEARIDASSTTTSAPIPGPGFNRNNNSRRNRQNRNRVQNSANIPRSIQSTTLQKFKGSETDIKAVLCMPNEKVEAGLHGFKHFQTELENFVLKKFDNASDLTPLITTLKDPLKTFSVDHPVPDKYTAEECEVSPFKANYMKCASNHYFLREQTLENNMRTLFSYILGQCTPALQAELKASSEYESQRCKYNSLWLLIEAKKIVSFIDGKGNKYYNAFHIIKSFHEIQQQGNESEEQWLQRFQAEVETIILAKCGHIFFSEEISGLDSATASQDKIETEQLKFQSMYFLLKSDPQKFAPLQQMLYTDMIKGQDFYPKTPTDAYNLLLRYLKSPQEVLGSSSNDSVFVLQFLLHRFV